jgi:hypothetical protein
MDGHFGSRPFVYQSGFTPLQKVSTHDTDHSRAGIFFPGGLDQVAMAIVKGIVFSYNADYFHG